MRVWVHTHFCQHFFCCQVCRCFVCCLNLAILENIKWDVFVIKSNIFIMTNDAKNVFTYSLAFIYFFVKCLSLLVIFFFYCNYVSVLYVFWTKDFWQMYMVWILSQIIACLLIFVAKYFESCFWSVSVMFTFFFFYI